MPTTTDRRDPRVPPRSPDITVRAEAPGVYTVEAKLDHAVTALGNNTVAELLGVSRSQPSRWRSGKEGMSAESRAAVTDLDYVLDRLLQLVHPKVAGIWLSSENAFLGGRPVDVLRRRGPRAVIDAIEALAQDAYA